MATKRSITFTVSDETYNRVRGLFPDVVGREDNFLALLDAYENKPEQETANNFRPFWEFVVNELESPSGTIEDVKIRIAHLKKLAEVNQVSEQSNIDDTTSKTICDMLHVDSISEVPEALQLLLNENQKETLQLLENQFIITTPPIAEKLLQETEIVLSKKKGRDVNREEILLDMFLRYTVFQWTEWFYPFCITNNRIVELANEANENISSIDQVKKLFKGGKR